MAINCFRRDFSSHKTNMNTTKVDKLAKIVWDYHHLNHQLKQADCIFVLGSHDIRVAKYAAGLFLQGYASYIVFSGGFGNLTKVIFQKSEAEIFTDIAVKIGVPPERILIENKSANTGENIKFTKKLLVKKGLNFNYFIIVQKPYMERRAFATFKKVWPEKNFIVTSPPISFDDYCNDEIPRDRVINLMVGNLQRIKIYPERGFQIFQAIPDKIWDAYKKLVELGYTKHLIKN